MQFVRAPGESLPFPNGHAGLVVCSNVLDHVNDAPQVLCEVFRILRPGGLLFLRVDTFSYLGLAKWNLWTKRRHANEILVRAHPYRFLEHSIEQICSSTGFEIVRTSQRGLISRWIGHSLTSTLLLKKP
jgi:ubiquinone/menaquinone biosynthesis C-methylase UbiE